MTKSESGLTVADACLCPSFVFYGLGQLVKATQSHQLHFVLSSTFPDDTAPLVPFMSPSCIRLLSLPDLLAICGASTACPAYQAGPHTTDTVVLEWP